MIFISKMSKISIYKKTLENSDSEDEVIDLKKVKIRVLEHRLKKK